MTITKLTQGVRWIKKSYNNIREVRVDFNLVKIKRTKILTPKELIKKYWLNKAGKNNQDITKEIDKIAYNI